MSALNGDKSRFNRERKQKIARRKKAHELAKLAAITRKPVDKAVVPAAPPALP
jgi:DNA-binding phage protein